MNINLKGKKALVCGSTRGIGKACALELASLGASVILLARNADDLEKVKNELPGTAAHEILVADFSRPDVLEIVIDEFIREYGPVHILVNNTGGPPGGAITDAKKEEFVQAFSNHLICNHILAKALLPGMKSEKYGRIINIISTSVKQPLKGLGVSNTVRAAVANWSKTLSNEVAAFGITVNNVLPGATLTGRLKSIIQTKAEKSGRSVEQTEKEMLAEIPAGRFADAGEIAAAVAFLASPAASYITGINVPVDGGRTSCL
jgi:3-oxoacyl-[acyl-carrier protein] reductase